MRLPDDNKRRQITETAAKMFASEPYHKVKLDDVAAAAGVGKGTLYVYFPSKEALYFSIIYEGFSVLVERLKKQLATDHTGASHRLRTIIDEMVDFSYQHPQFYELMRAIGMPGGSEGSEWNKRRDELYDLIEQTIRGGIESGEFHDEHPTLTARYIPGLIRSAMLFGPSDLLPAALKTHIHTLLAVGLACQTPTKLPI